MAKLFDLQSNYKKKKTAKEQIDKAQCHELSLDEGRLVHSPINSFLLVLTPCYLKGNKDSNRNFTLKEGIERKKAKG